MPKIPPRKLTRKPTRIRQLPGDTRIHITGSGHTISGHVVSADVILEFGESPRVILEMREREPNPYDPELVTTRVDLSARELHRADLEALDYQAMPYGQSAELRRIADHISAWLIDGPAPACGHEDVLDVTDLGDTDARGLCVWCGAGMVAEQRLEAVRGEWRPA